MSLKIDEMHNGVGKFNTPERNPILASPATTARAINEIQRWFIEETRLGIPVDFTNEGVRGLNATRLGMDSAIPLFPMKT